MESNRNSIVFRLPISPIVQVGLLAGNLWPSGWEAYQAFRPVAFLPARYEIIFIINHHHHQSANHTTDSPLESIGPVLTWNSLETGQWNSSWRSKVLKVPGEPGAHSGHQLPLMVTFTGMFEMNGVVYAIGEREEDGGGAGVGRVGRMYRYFVTNADGRDLQETVSGLVQSRVHSIIDGLLSLSRTKL